MNKKITFLFCLIITVLNIEIMSNTVRLDGSGSYDYSAVKPYIVPFDVENYRGSDDNKQGALLAGFYTETDFDPFHAGETVVWDNGETSRIIKINLPDAPALAVFINQLNLAKDSRISIFPENEPDKRYTIYENEIKTNIISFPVITGETIIVEYTEKTSEDGNIKGFFVICEILAIFRGIDFILETKELGTASKCNVNINCSPEGDARQNQKRGVAKMIMKLGTKAYLCTGSLVNNTNNDCKPYFLTAFHCAGEANEADREKWQFYFNYERPGCANTGIPPQNMVTGCTLVAGAELKGGSDFQLLLLNEFVNPVWKPYFIGWDWDVEAPSSGVCIHHPDGDAKKISTFTDRATSVTPQIGSEKMAIHSAWKIIWTETENGYGITEGGSSGSPLLNSRGLIVGTLTGGSTSCDDPGSYDVFGKFSYHWESNGTRNKEKLKPWLDPKNLGVKSISGFDPEIPYFDVTFFITNNWDVPVENAHIEIEEAGITKPTSIDGMAVFSLPQAKFNYSIKHNNYIIEKDTFTVKAGVELKKITLDEDLKYIVLFPNPFSEQVNIANAKNVKRISIYSFMGELIFSEQVANKKSINVSYLKPGLYLFVTEDNKGRKKSFKMLKQPQIHQEESE